MPVEPRPQIGLFGPTVFYQLFTDLELALSFLKTARLMPSGKSKTFYEAQAVKIYRTASHSLARLHMRADTRETLSEKLLQLKRELLSLGMSEFSAEPEKIAS